MTKDLYRVDISLKDKQRQAFNKWAFTHCGEPKIGLDRHVRFHVEDLTKICDTYVQDEIQSIVITWTDSNAILYER